MTSDLVCTECGFQCIFEALACMLHTHTAQVFVSRALRADALYLDALSRPLVYLYMPERK